MTELNISETDFSTIRANLKTYLENQTQFQDYSFDGSAISVLLDILSYNTHMTASHANLAFAESFLDSATLRGSIVSRAKEMGYTPRSKTSAVATIQISFTVDGNPAQYTIPKNTKFITTSGDTSYSFVNKEDYLVENIGDTFSQEIDIYQGKFTTFQYIVDLTDASQRFVIPSLDVDTNFLTVLFKENDSISDWTPYSYYKDFSHGEIDGGTKLFYFLEAFDEYFEVYFGDNVLGKELENNNVIRLEYLITDGPDANNAQTFDISSVLTGVNNISINTISNSSGGAERETTDSIKFLAPLHYTSGERAVTEDDYKSIIKNKYSDVDDVSIWGGERNDPPYYGKVFISIKPTIGGYLTTSTKEAIQDDILSRYNIVSIRPEIIDPDYIYVSVDTVITYNGRLYNPDSGINISELVENAIINFFDTSVNKFGISLYYSKLVGSIDDVSSLILNSITNIQLEKELEIFSGISGQYVFNFNNAISPGSVISNSFIISGETWKIKDVPNDLIPPTEGTLVVFKEVSGVTTYYNEDIGTVDYTTGEVIIDNLKIDSVVDEPSLGVLKMQVSPGAVADPNNPDVVYLDKNVYTNGLSQIVTLKEINTTLIPDNTQ